MIPNDDAAPTTKNNLLERCNEKKSRSRTSEKESLALLHRACENAVFDLLQCFDEARMDIDSGVKIGGDVIEGTTV